MRKTKQKDWVSALCVEIRRHRLDLRRQRQSQFPALPLRTRKHLLGKRQYAPLPGLGLNPQMVTRPRHRDNRSRALCTWAGSSPALCLSCHFSEGRSHRGCSEHQMRKRVEWGLARGAGVLGVHSTWQIAWGIMRRSCVPVMGWPLLG